MREFLDVLKVARERIQSAIDRGLSEDQAIAADLMSDYNAKWGGGFMNPENFVRLSYQSLVP